MASSVMAGASNDNADFYDQFEKQTGGENFVKESVHLSQLQENDATRKAANYNAAKEKEDKDE